MNHGASRDESGSATVWAVCILMFVSAATGWALLWVAAESTRHATERAADSAALAAAGAAMHRLSAQAGPDPCDVAAEASSRAGAKLTGCECVPLDCTLSVERPLPWLGSFVGRLPDVAGLGPARATSRAGPVGETSTG